MFLFVAESTGLLMRKQVQAHNLSKYSPCIIKAVPVLSEKPKAKASDTKSIAAAYKQTACICIAVKSAGGTPDTAKQQKRCNAECQMLAV